LCTQAHSSAAYFLLPPPQSHSARRSQPLREMSSCARIEYQPWAKVRHCCRHCSQMYSSCSCRRRYHHRHHPMSPWPLPAVHCEHVRGYETGLFVAAVGGEVEACLLAWRLVCCFSLDAVSWMLLPRHVLLLGWLLHASPGSSAPVCSSRTQCYVYASTHTHTYTHTYTHTHTHTHTERTPYVIRLPVYNMHCKRSYALCMLTRTK
jgi:hypothetical protein